jgi:NAD(P)-dependent dehydrogenase (short-subunit alcohol dehydrogenase family)
MLSEKVCIVTGAGTGIGEAVAVELGRFGAQVVVNDLGTDLAGCGESEEPAEGTAAAVRDAGGDALAHTGDVTSLPYAETLVEDAVAEYGRVDGIANFAGNLSDAPLWEMSGDEWDRVLHVHLRGHFALLRSAARYWRERALDGDGLDAQPSFVCVSSGSGAIGIPNQSNYCAAKAGVLGLTRTAARELAEFDVRVNALMPFANTRMAENVPEEDRNWDIDDLPTPDEMAPIVAFLLSDHATDVTGCSIAFEGDEMALVSDPEKVRVAYCEGGWSTEAVVERFRSALGGNRELDRSTRRAWD